jgi:DNA mismatch repair protein MutL
VEDKDKTGATTYEPQERKGGTPARKGSAADNRTEANRKTQPRKEALQEETTPYVKDDLTQRTGEADFNWRDNPADSPLNNKRTTTTLPGENLTLFSEQMLMESSFDIIVGQAFETYILLQKGEELYFMDQHAAHERILWEQIRRQDDHWLSGSQITLPLPFDLPEEVAEELSGKLKILEGIGLELEQFGHNRNTFIIRKVPLFLKDHFNAEMLTELLEILAAKQPEKEDFLKESLMQLACKTAVKANKTLTSEEVRALLKQLQECENPFFCPHGRPVFFKMSKIDLENFFKRR